MGTETDSLAEAIREFIAESSERLAEVDSDLMALEAAGEQASPHLVFDIYRTIHSVRSVSGYLDLSDISDLAHRCETVLNRLTTGELSCTDTVIDVLLRGVGKLHLMIDDVARTNAVDVSDVMTHLILLSTGEAPLQRRHDLGLGPLAPPVAEPAAAGIPVDPSHIDDLLRVSTTLAVAGGQLHAAIARLAPSLEEAAGKVLGLITELQQVLAETRAEPISRFEGQLQQLVRDLARCESKEALLVFESDDVTLDRDVLTVVERAVAEVVSAAIMSSLEPPEQRERAGKPRVGTVRVKAMQHDAGALIVISDDGNDAISAEDYDAHLLGARGTMLESNGALSLTGIDGGGKRVCLQVPATTASTR